MLKSITVEPVFFFYILNFYTYGIIYQNLQIEKACRVNLNQTSIVCDNLEDPTNAEIQDEVQKMVANIKMYGSFLSAIPAFICVSFLGPISDLVGRRRLLVLPFLGHVLIAGLLMLNVYMVDWPVEATLLESLWGLCGGGFASVMTLGYTYLADVTSQADRTTRISIADAVMILAQPLGNFVGARLYLGFGYYTVFGVSGLFALAGALYSAFILEETTVIEEKTEGAERPTVWTVLKQKNPLTIVRTLCRPRKGLKRVMVLWSLLLFFVHNLYYKDGLYLYTRKKFGWNEQDFTLYLSMDNLHSFARAIVVTPFLSKVIQHIQFISNYY
jgi:PCFT/HCP family folate transporter-like MFS transporter 1/3